MVIAIFGESCVGKSTIAEKLASRLNAEVFSGKDYLKLAKSESMAALLFKKKLAAPDGNILYVIMSFPKRNSWRFCRKTAFACWSRRVLIPSANVLPSACTVSFPRR